MLSNGHVRCGGRAGETGREKSRNRAPARPYFSVRPYSGRKLLVKPSKAAVKRLRARLAAEVRSLRGLNALAVVTKLNPIIRGWAAYYRSAVSGRVFAALDNYLWQLLYKWSTWSHHDKPKSWIVGRYFGKRNKFRNDHWVFGAPGIGAYVVKFAWTGIVRHVMVKGGASPDDPELAGYRAERRRKVKPPLDGYTLRLLAKISELEEALEGAEFFTAEHAALLAAMLASQSATRHRQTARPPYQPARGRGTQLT
jgi:Group II intron, maturase-specific domain